MAILVYVDDCLLFGPKGEDIDEVIQELKDDGFDLTHEDDAFAFLGVQVTPLEGGTWLSQRGLIDKVLRTTGMA